MIKITQGDQATLQLTAENGEGVAHNLTGATFETKIIGTSGTQTFANAKHAITSAAAGTFTLTLDEADTVLLKLGKRDIVTKVTQSSNDVYFHAYSIIQVLQATPEN
jgi:hypothetical protein